MLQRRNDQRTDNRTEPRGKNLLLAMRDSLARSSIGSRLMSYHASLRKDLQDSLGHTPATSRMSMQDTSLTHMARPPNTLPACDAAKDIVHKTNFEPSEQRRVSFCQVKRIVSSRLSRSTSPITLCGTPMSPDCVSHTRAATTSGDSTASDSTAEYRTPPSTPHLDYDLSPGSLDHELYHRNPESAELIREGKRPAQPTVGIDAHLWCISMIAHCHLKSPLQKILKTRTLTAYLRMIVRKQSQIIALCMKTPGLAWAMYLQSVERSAAPQVPHACLWANTQRSR